MAMILVVEDDIMLVALLEDFLDQEGHRVLVARDGMEALALVGRELPDLILCDVRMPRMGGTELCLRVRSAPRTRAIPVILMSSAPPPDLATIGAVAFIAKPFRLDARGRLLAEHLAPEQCRGTECAANNPDTPSQNGAGGTARCRRR